MCLLRLLFCCCLVVSRVHRTGVWWRWLCVGFPLRGLLFTGTSENARKKTTSATVLCSKRLRSRSSPKPAMRDCRTYKPQPHIRQIIKYDKIKLKKFRFRRDIYFELVFHSKWDAGILSPVFSPLVFCWRYAVVVVVVAVVNAPWQQHTVFSLPFWSSNAMHTKY